MNPDDPIPDGWSQQRGPSPVVQRLARKGFPVHLHRGPMTDAERVTWETR